LFQQIQGPQVPLFIPSLRYIQFSSRGGRPAPNAGANPNPTGRALVARLKDNQFLMAGCPPAWIFVPPRPTGAASSSRSKNGDQTDYGLQLGSEPLVLRVSLATY
jgi:hypothetical protein